MTQVSAYLKPIADHWEWQEQGACRDFDTETFFLEDKARGKKKRDKEKAAVSICNTCPVKIQCLSHALGTPEIFGVWGGTTEDQRWDMLKKRGATFEYIRV